jgi:hypothetical protein
MTIKEAAAWSSRFSNTRVRVEHSPDVPGHENDVRVLVEDEAIPRRFATHSALIPEAEWRRLCRESCGEPQVIVPVEELRVGEFIVTANGKYLEIDNPNDGRAMITPDQLHEMCARGLGPESFVDPKRSPQWQDGPPTEKYVPYAIEYRAHIIPHKKVELRVFAGTLQRIIEDADPEIYVFGEDFPIPNGPGEVTIPKADIVRHFRVPDPPKAEPVPDPPKFVRVEATSQNQVCRSGRRGWGIVALSADEPRWAVRVDGDDSPEISPHWAIGCWREIRA